MIPISYRVSRSLIGSELTGATQLLLWRVESDIHRVAAAGWPGRSRTIFSFPSCPVHTRAVLPCRDRRTCHHTSLPTGQGGGSQLRTFELREGKPRVGPPRPPCGPPTVGDQFRGREESRSRMLPSGLGDQLARRLA